MSTAVDSDLDTTVRLWVRTALNELPSALIKRAYCPPEALIEDTEALVQLTQFQYGCLDCGAETPDVQFAVDTHFRRHPDAPFPPEDLLEAIPCPACHQRGGLRPFPGNKYGGILPAWGSLWMFDERYDEDWAREHLALFDSLRLVVYETEDVGLFFGVDGAGYNFYTQHFTPLYQALYSHK